MDRIINYGGGLYKPMTSNSDYGRGVLASMRKGQMGGIPGTFDPAATNYYPQVVTGGGNPKWPSQSLRNPAQGHVHAPNCPHFGNKSTQGGPMAEYQNAQPATDHIEVLHGDAAQAYLAQSNGGQGGGNNPQANYSDPAPEPQGNGSEGGNETGMTVSFQQAAEGSGDNSGTNPTPVNNNEGAHTGSTQYKRGTSAGGDYVRATGLPMGRTPKWHQSHPTIPHAYSSTRFPKGNNSQPPVKLCGKCPKCKGMQDPNALRPAVINFREEGLTPSGSRRFPIPRATSAPKKQSVPQGGAHGRHTHLPIQGQMSNMRIETPPAGQPHK